MRHASAALTLALVAASATIPAGVGAAEPDETPVAVVRDSPSDPATLVVEVDRSVDPAALGAVLDVVAGDDIDVVDSIARFGLLTVTATDAGEALVEQLNVIGDIHESRDFRLFVEESPAIIEADLLRADGATGAGKVVAVVDSGVDKAHPGLSGAVVGESCYLANTSALCPNGLKSDETVGSGVPCTGDPEACSHGSHVAGIIAAEAITVGSEADVAGVAPDVGILSIRVMDGELTNDVAVLAALDRVLELHQNQTHDIAAVNLSLGAKANGCSAGPWRTAIDQLNDAGIAVIAASGNTEGDPVAFPACLDGVIAVGASVRDTPVGPGYACASDVAPLVADFTQIGPELDLVAPGVCIDSTVLTTYDPDGISSWNGTSMAAPHVAALFALLDGSQPGWTPERSMELLRTTGEMITYVTADPSDRDPRYPEPRAHAALGFQPFDDAGSGFWVNAADWAKFTDVSTGTGDNLFDPDRTLTRAEAVTFLWRLMGRPEPTTAHPFADVEDGRWFSDAIAWAFETDITTGTSATEFEPNADVSRGEVATFFWRLVGKPDHGTDSGFTDVADGLYYTKPVTWMALFGITTGTSATEFSPGDIVTRAQMITFLWRLVNAGDAWADGVDIPDGAVF